MPIYEFVCRNCDSHFEKIQSFSDSTPPNCPTCTSEEVARQMSRPAIHFKGSGWYITDSKKAEKPSANGASKNGSENGASESSVEHSESSDKSSEPAGEKSVAKKGSKESASKAES